MKCGKKAYVFVGKKSPVLSQKNPVLCVKSTNIFEPTVTSGPIVSTLVLVNSVRAGCGWRGFWPHFWAHLGAHLLPHFHRLSFWENGHLAQAQRDGRGWILSSVSRRHHFIFLHAAKHAHKHRHKTSSQDTRGNSDVGSKLSRGPHATIAFSAPQGMAFRKCSLSAAWITHDMQYLARKGRLAFPRKLAGVRGGAWQTPIRVG